MNAKKILKKLIFIKKFKKGIFVLFRMFGKNHYLPENNAETLQKIFSMCCKKNKQSIIRKNSTKLSVNNFFVEGKNYKT